MNSAMIKRVQQMKREMERTQEEIVNTEFKTSVGPVTVIMMGDRNLKQIVIDEDFEVSSKEDLEMLCDMIVASSKKAGEEIDKFTAEKMGKYQALLGGF